MNNEDWLTMLVMRLSRQPEDWKGKPGVRGWQSWETDLIRSRRLAYSVFMNCSGLGGGVGGGGGFWGGGLGWGW